MTQEYEVIYDNSTGLVCHVNKKIKKSFWQRLCEFFSDMVKKIGRAIKVVVIDYVVERVLDLLPGATIVYRFISAFARETSKPSKCVYPPLQRKYFLEKESYLLYFSDDTIRYLDKKKSIWIPVDNNRYKFTSDSILPYIAFRGKRAYTDANAYLFTY